MPGISARLLGGRYLLTQTRRADLVHVVASVPGSAVASATLIRTWGRLSRRRIVHSVPAITHESFDRRTLVGDVTVVFSQHSKELLTGLGIPDVVCLFPPLDVATLRPSEDPEDVRRRHDLGPLPILYATHLDEGNGMAEAIQALALLPKSLAEATLVLAMRWRSGQEVEPRVAELHGLAKHLGVDHRIRWLTHVTNMPALITACAATVLAPRHLAGKMDLPLILLESLALGRPIIVSNRPPITEALLGGGLETPFGDLQALADALTALLGDEDLRIRLAAVGRTRLLELADPARSAAAYSQIYRQLFDGRT
jgi:glycosyltransferase involved in cell wall biosynthesis